MEPAWVEEWLRVTPQAGLDESKREFLRVVDADPFLREHFQVEVLSVEGPADRPELVILFRLPWKPRCLYGCRQLVLSGADPSGLWVLFHEILDGVHQLPGCPNPDEAVFVS